MGLYETWAEKSTDLQPRLVEKLSGNTRHTKVQEIKHVSTDRNHFVLQLIELRLKHTLHVYCDGSDAVIAAADSLVTLI